MNTPTKRCVVPARIDLAGGTLDIPPLSYIVEDSLTLNLAIDMKVNLSLRPTLEALVHEKGVPPVPIAQVPLYKLAFDYFGEASGFSVFLDSDIPRASGLGGSSSVLVALSYCLESLRGKVLLEKLLNQVTVLEHQLLGKPAGVQDALAAIFGGLNQITFSSGTPQHKRHTLPSFLSGPLLLAYSKTQHHSGINNWEIIKSACEGDLRTKGVLRDLARNAHRMNDAVQLDNRAQFAESLQTEAELRAGLAPHILTHDMAAFAHEVRDRVISKVCGAGGGGCMFLFGDTRNPADLKEIAGRYNLEILTTAASLDGCREVEA